MRCRTLLIMVVVPLFLPMVCCSDPPSGIEAEQYERATELSHLGRRGEAVKILRGLQSPLAKARLALLIAKDNVTSRLLGIASFDPNLAARLAKESIPVLRRDAETDAQARPSLEGFMRTALVSNQILRPLSSCTSRLRIGDTSAQWGRSRGATSMALGSRRTPEVPLVGSSGPPILGTPSRW